MGNIPLFQQSYVPEQTVFRSIESAGGIGRAGQQLGDFAQKVGTEKMQHQAEVDALTWTNEQGLKAEATLNDAMDEFQRTNTANPKEKYKDFDTLAQARLKEIADQAPSPAAREMFDRFGQQLRGNYQSKMQAWEDVTTAAAYAQRVEDGANTIQRMAYQSGDLSQLDNLLGKTKGNVIAGAAVSGADPLKVGKMTKTQMSGTVKALLLGAAEHGDPAAARAALKEERFNKHLSGDDLIQLDNSLESIQKQREAQGIQDRNKKATALQNDWDYRSMKGEDVTQQIQTAYDNGEINGAEYVDSIKKQKSNQDYLLENLGGQNRMNLVLQGKGSLNPSDKKDMKAFDNYYQGTFLPSLSGQDPEQQALAQVNMVSKFGVVPTSLKSNIEGSLLAGPPDSQVQTASMVARMATDAPRAAAQLSSESLGYALKLNDLVTSGVSADKAIEAAQQQQFLSNSPEYQARAQDFNKQTGGMMPNIKFDSGDFSQYFRNDPAEVPFAMKRQWEALARFGYVDQNMSADAAMKYANSKISENWGITTTAGDGSPQWMQFAPENYYAPGGDSEWIKGQLSDDIGQAILFENSEKKDAFLKQSYLVPVPSSLNKNGKPIYYVYHQDDNGVNNVVLAHNPKSGEMEAMVFAPDYNATPMGKKLKDDQAAAQDKLNKNAERAYDALKTKERIKGEKAKGVNFQDNPVLPNPDAATATKFGA